MHVQRHCLKSSQFHTDQRRTFPSAQRTRSLLARTKEDQPIGTFKLYWHYKHYKTSSSLATLNQWGGNQLKWQKSDPLPSPPHWFINGRQRPKLPSGLQGGVINLRVTPPKQLGWTDDICSPLRHRSQEQTTNALCFIFVAKQFRKDSHAQANVFLLSKIRRKPNSRLKKHDVRGHTRKMNGPWKVQGCEQTSPRLLGSSSHWRAPWLVLVNLTTRIDPELEFPSKPLLRKHKLLSLCTSDQ